MRTAARDILNHGLECRGRQDMEAAREAIAEAAALEPDDAFIAAAHAHISFETWQASAHLFERARKLDPSRLETTRGWAAALNAEGCAADAILRLERALAQNPGWIDGHKFLATLRVTAGEPDGFDRSFGEACGVQPGNLALRLAWFHVLSSARDWGRARTVIREGVEALGPQRALDVATVFLASESDEASRDPHLFDRVAAFSDPGLDQCRVRFLLRTGKPEDAEVIAASYVNTPSARAFWPYLSLAWRLLEDPRAEWLDGAPMFVGLHDLCMTNAGLGELGATLRRLLTLRAPYLEQSVRGGIQTDRHLFFNPDPVIQKLRTRITRAVEGYISGLPPRIDGHPLLGAPREKIRYEGSWSVLLRGQGFHASHTHKMGWISSALHISLPRPVLSGPPTAGWLMVGAPPPELGLDLAPTLKLKPKPGSLVLFPSTTWHGTAPFSEGERLTVAFDVKIPSIASQG